LRHRWLQLRAVDRFLLADEDNQAGRLSALEQQFLNWFVDLARNGERRVSHRLLSKHHATAEHHPTPAEMLDNCGICVDRGEILVQPSRTPPIKLVMIAATKRTEAELGRIVRAYHRQCKERDVRPTLKGLVAEAHLSRPRLREAWLKEGYKLRHGGRR
jgi:hypothetical protein